MNIILYYISVASYAVGAGLMAPDLKTGFGSVLMGFAIITALRGLGERLSNKEAT